MKKHVEATPERLSTLRQRLFAVLAMLMVAIVLTVATSFAWLIMSIRPEVSGITSNIGSNGSLEIALLDGETYKNLSAIKNPGVGESLEAGSPAANNRWGNLLSLEDASYGLQKITLYPSRLNINSNGRSLKDLGSILSVPSYGYDGRIVSVSNKTVTGTYTNSEFLYDSEKLGYGVRAIGATNSLTVQGSALISAKGNIASYMSRAKSNATASFSGFERLLTNLVTGSNFDDDSVAVLKNSINNLKGSANYIESALRQGMVAFAASTIADATVFETARALITNENKSLSEIIKDDAIKGFASKIPLLENWINDLADIKSTLESALKDCSALSGGSYEHSVFTPIFNDLMDGNKMYINGTPYPEIEDKKALATQLPLEITLPQGSGVYADIADFVGNFQANVGNFATIKTAAPNQAHLSVLQTAVNGLTAAGGGSEASKKIAIDDVYGYALDFAFRTNAFASDLLLQTEGAQRVYDDSESAATMGGGSYMEFTFKNTNFGPNDITKLMDAVRVAFIDSLGNVLGISKLNTNNRSVDGDAVKAPLYLHDFSVTTTGTDAGRLEIGKRKNSNTLTALTQNTAKAISTVVWLDGDLVDNTMVSADQNLTGMLNLQFASSVDLTPMGNEALKNYTLNKDNLAKDVKSAEAIYNKNQGNYTDASWTDFENAYNYANKINALDTATPMQVQRAGDSLSEATKGLTTVANESLNKVLSEVRDIVGKTNSIIGYVEETLEDGKVTSSEFIFYTTEKLPKDTDTKKYSNPVYSVDSSKNVLPEGKDKTENLPLIYTTASWDTLVQKLYEVESDLALGVAKTEKQISALIPALQTALDGLRRNIYYAPYEYEGTLYYKPVTNTPDNYSAWYDSEFKPVTGALIANLSAWDTGAKAVNIAKLGDGTAFLKNDTTALTVELRDDIYNSLKKQTIVASKWNGYVGNASNVKIENILFDGGVLYEMPYEILDVNVSSVTGEITLSGQILTDAGVLFNYSEKVTVYKPSDVKINQSSISTKVEGKGTLTCSIVGGNEEIDTKTWFLSKGSAATVTLNENTGEWEALKEGTVFVCVKVTTKQGNTYYSGAVSITVR